MKLTKHPFKWNGKEWKEKEMTESYIYFEGMRCPFSEIDLLKHEIDQLKKEIDTLKKDIATLSGISAYDNAQLSTEIKNLKDFIKDELDIK